MLTRIATWSISSAMLLFFLGVTTIKAGDCSVKTVSGSVGFLEQGAFLTPTGMMPLPYVASGTAILDGAGHVSGKVTAHIGGMVLNDTFTGTYTVNPDCTYSMDFTGASGDVHHQFGTITGEGVFQEARYIYTDTNLVVAGTAKKTSAGK